MSRGFLPALALLLGLAVQPMALHAEDDVPLIAAAANLQFAIDEVARSFTADMGMAVRLSMGSTGNFARQIREGAPYELFLAADDATPLALAREGLARDEGVVYAVGRIVLIVPNGSALRADGTLGSLAEALAAGTINRFAIANPEHAPFGVAAREALARKGLWDRLQPHLVFGENVSQAAQFAVSGNAEGGIIAYSLALAPNVSDKGSFALIPAEWHEPLRQRMVLLKNAGPVAEAFYDYMKRPAAREIMARYGFVVPEGE